MSNCLALYNSHYLFISVSSYFKLVPLACLKSWRYFNFHWVDLKMNQNQLHLLTWTSSDWSLESWLMIGVCQSIPRFLCVLLLLWGTWGKHSGINQHFRVIYYNFLVTLRLHVNHIKHWQQQNLKKGEAKFYKGMIELLCYNYYNLLLTFD